MRVLMVGMFCGDQTAARSRRAKSTRPFVGFHNRSHVSLRRTSAPKPGQSTELIPNVGDERPPGVVGLRFGRPTVRLGRRVGDSLPRRMVTDSMMPIAVVNKSTSTRTAKSSFSDCARLGRPRGCPISRDWHVDTHPPVWRLTRWISVLVWMLPF